MGKAISMDEARRVVAMAGELAAVKAERDSLAAFKAYVHKRLDEGGVPADPPSVHRISGCRIGGRLDHLLAQRDELLAACEAATVPLTGGGDFLSPDDALDKLRAAIAKARPGGGGDGNG